MGPGTVHRAALELNQMAEHVAPDNSMRAVSHIPKFDGSNHREWNYEIDLCFQNLEIAEVVLGQEVCSTEVKQSRELLFTFI